MKVHTQVRGVGRAPTMGARFDRAREDLLEGLRRWQLWTTLGWQDLRNRYRRSVLGPFWITLSMGGFIAGLGSLYGGLFGYDAADYVPHLAIGMILWSFITACVAGGCQTFISSASAIRQVKAPLSIHLYNLLWKHLLSLAHLVVIIPVVLAIFDRWPGPEAVLAIPGFLLVLTVCSGAALTLGVVCARYRDVPPMVAMVMRVFFFFTPIIWKAEVSKRAIFVDINPFYYLLEVVRAPLLGTAPAPHVWIVTLVLALTSWAIGLALYARLRHRIAFWV